MTVLAWNLTRSRIGRAFTALRDSEIGAHNHTPCQGAQTDTHIGLYIPEQGIGFIVGGDTTAFDEADHLKPVQVQET